MRSQDSCRHNCFVICQVPCYKLLMMTMTVRMMAMTMMMMMAMMILRGSVPRRANNSGLSFPMFSSIYLCIFTYLYPILSIERI